MTTHYDFVVIGGGLAGATAVETLRAEGAKGSILLLSEEVQLPYQRPPLSKSFITSERSPMPTLILSESKYSELEVEVSLGTRVTAIDPGNKLLRTLPRGNVHYNQLLITTGAAPCRLSIPGATLGAIHYLRSLTDAEAIRSSAQIAKRAVVIGGSLIGLEIAASLRQRGIQVTLIERGGLLDELHTPEISSFFQRSLERHGVEVVVGDTPESFLGTKAIQAVVTHGGRTLRCDMAVIGVGVTPETEFLQGSGIKVDNGILVDRFLQTNQPGIFAAGDVANFFDTVFNFQHRFEHWDNAVKHGRLAARNMLGQRLPYAEVSYFFSHVFDLSFNVLGLIEEPFERIDRGSLEAGSFASFYLRDNVPRALFSLGRPSEETKVTEALIKHRVNLIASKPRLSDPEFKLSQIPNQTIFILQGGGAFGAFEYGAVKALDESGIRPDIVAGISIGAFNSAIIAGNPDRPIAALQDFWNDLSTLSLDLPDENMRRLLACGQIALFGNQKFFQPRWLIPMLSPDQLPYSWSSLYDTTPAKKLLEKYVDFSRLKSSPIRLLVNAVDVQTSEVVVFDSYVDDLTSDHILASGSLPPSFPWTTIDGKHYWDGGIVSNSPLARVIERCGSAGKRVFIIDLFPGKRTSLPANLLDVMARRDEILYSERIRSDLRTRDMVREFQKLVDEIVSELPPEAVARIRHQPRFIQLMGAEAPMTITRIVREDSEDEPPWTDYDFSKRTIEQLIQSGYRLTNKALGL